MEFTASSIMRARLVTCNATDSLKEVARKMLEEKVGSVLVKNNGGLSGIITDRDIMHAIATGVNVEESKAEEIMSSPLEYCDSDDTLAKCKEIFEKTHHSRLVVKKGNEVVGVLLRKLVDRFSTVSKLYSLTHTTQTPHPRTGRG
jgi:CBS domain-containing protein